MTYSSMEYLDDIKRLTNRYKEVLEELRDIRQQVEDTNESFLESNRTTVVTESALGIGQEMIEQVCSTKDYL